MAKRYSVKNSGQFSLGQKHETPPDEEDDESERELKSLRSQQSGGGQGDADVQPGDLPPEFREPAVAGIVDEAKAVRAKE